MLTPQETRLLSSLRRAGGPLEEQRLSTLAGLPTSHLNRILADMEWRGLVVVMSAAGGGMAMLTPLGSQLAPG